MTDVGTIQVTFPKDGKFYVLIHAQNGQIAITREQAKTLTTAISLKLKDERLNA